MQLTGKNLSKAAQHIEKIKIEDNKNSEPESDERRSKQKSAESSERKTHSSLQYTVPSHKLVNNSLMNKYNNIIKENEGADECKRQIVYQKEKKSKVHT